MQIIRIRFGTAKIANPSRGVSGYKQQPDHGHLTTATQFSPCPAVTCDMQPPGPVIAFHAITPSLGGQQLIALRFGEPPKKICTQHPDFWNIWGISDGTEAALHLTFSMAKSYARLCKSPATGVGVLRRGTSHSGNVTTASMP